MSKKLTHEIFLERMKKIDENIEFLEEYSGRLNRIKCKCLIDGYEWNPIAKMSMKGSGCPRCAGNAKLTNDEFIERIRNVNKDIEPLDIYTGSNDKIRFKCKIDGYIWAARSSSVMYGTGCPRCHGVDVPSQEEFIERIRNINENIICIDEYINSTTKIRFKCAVCNHIWNSTPGNILSGNGCPVCNESKGEKAIRIFLQNNRIDFVAQKEFDGLIGLGGGNLKYDFYIEDMNLLIEYQGVQHERPVNFDRNGNAEERFEYRQEHDRRKREYAKYHNINLLEIWYYDFENIETILTQYLGNQAAA